MNDKKDFEAALKGKKVPLLVLDQKWHRLFAIHGKTDEISATEKELDELLKLQGKYNNELKNLKKLKSKIMSNIVANMGDDGDEKRDKDKQLIDEINALHIEGMPRLERLNALVGKYVNLEYRLPNGMNVKFLDDEKTYLGNQLECEFGGDRYFGVLADMDFILISTYEAEGTNPELVLYKKR